MGTMIQALRLDEEAFRGARFDAWNREVRGNNDLLNLTQPDAIRSIHLAYFRAGADIVSTNTFSSTRIAQADYGMAEIAYELNVEGARLVREAARIAQDEDGRERFVAGAIGPTNRTASISPDVSNPGFRAITFDQLREAYGEQVRGLIDGGVDTLLIETIFDTLNAKAAIFAIADELAARGIDLPVMISGTITDRSGRLLSGQTPEAFWNSIAHAAPISVGTQLRARRQGDARPYRRTRPRRRHADLRLSQCRPAQRIRPLRRRPRRHGDAARRIRRLRAWSTSSAAAAARRPTISAPSPAPSPARRRAKFPKSRRGCGSSGLEPFTLTPEIPFVNVGERTNVTGSARFRKLVTAGDYPAALAVARDQVENGAQIIDINMDEGLLDSEKAMTTFLNLVAAEPDIARVPVMIDSSKFSVIEAGLKCVQGKAVVNSISLKEGEEAFIRHAETVRRYGAAVVVMAFDETGQADTLEKKQKIATRAYDILVNRVGFPPQDIIFDPNIFAIATGMEEHNDYGVDFIEGTRWIRQNLPHAHVSGGVSNLSFSFRGNEAVREAMHAVFLYHAIKAGMDMGIVNAGQIAVYDDLDPELREACEDVVLNRRADAAERLLGARRAASRPRQGEERSRSLLARNAGREAAVARARSRHHRFHRRGRRGSAAESAAPARGDRRPADGRHERRRRPVRFRPDVPAAGGEVGAGDEAGRIASHALYGAGPRRPRTFLVERQDRARHRQGRRARHRQEHRRRRAPVQQLRRRSISASWCRRRRSFRRRSEERADIVGLSGLITPSLDEMCHVAAELERQGFDVPLLIGGATTSRVHTAVKIHPQLPARPDGLCQ